MLSISMITLALGGVFGLIGWIFALLALNYQSPLFFADTPSLWAAAMDYPVQPSFMIAAVSVFIVSTTAWLPGFLSFYGATMAHRKRARAWPFGMALGCMYMLCMTLAVLYFIYRLDLSPSGIGPSATNRERQMTRLSTFLLAAPFTIILTQSRSPFAFHSNAGRANDCEWLLVRIC